MVVVIRTGKVLDMKSYVRARQFDAWADGKIFYEDDIYECAILYAVDGVSFKPALVQIFKDGNRDDCFDVIDLEADVKKYNGICMGTHLEVV